MLRGVDYHVNEWGDPLDPLIILLHGWGDCGATFQFVVDALEHDWFVIAPDWRGFGLSAEGRNGTAAYWFPEYLADLDALLAIYSPDAAVSFVGHSMGANVAGLYAGVMPERVAAFVNVEGFGLPDADAAAAPANYRRWIEVGRKIEPYSTYETYEALAARIARRNPGVRPDRALFIARHWATEDVTGTVRLRADPAHKLPNAVLYRRSEAEACWSRISARVLRVCGADSEFAAAAAAWVPGRDWPTEVIAGAGHMVHFEQPERLAALLESFLVNSSSTG
jgi:pimeloyl-ACP methyl ester carboxylesterase